MEPIAIRKQSSLRKIHIPATPPKAETPWIAAAGKAAAPQRQEQVHCPSVTVPVPVTILPVDAAAAAAAVVVEPPVMPEAVPVPFCAIAMDSNIACVLVVVGLMENVMPLPQ